MNRLALLLAGCALAGLARAEPFTGDDWTRQLAYSALHVADWQQTRRIARSPQWVEGNPLLGPKPSQAQVNRYFAGTLVAHWALAATLPPSWRVPFQQGTIALEVSVVRSNTRLGVSASF